MSTSPGNGPAIELRGLIKRFGATLAVGNLSLAVERGSTLGLIGPNGAGKTTTLKILMGMLSPTGGEVRVLGTSPMADPTWVKRRVGYVPEVQHIYRWMRVRQVIGFCRSLQRILERRNVPAHVWPVRTRPQQEGEALVQGDAGQALSVARHRSRS